MTRRIATDRALDLPARGPGRPAARRGPRARRARLKAARRDARLPRVRRAGRARGARRLPRIWSRRSAALKLEPLFDGSYTQPILAGETGANLGCNVGARLRGSDPALRDEWIIVSAHFDHLGVRDGVLFPGADDNASGVAMMLEVARSFVAVAEQPKRSVMFVGFDLEETGLFGSRYFVEHPPVPLDRIALVHHRRHDRPVAGGRLPRLRLRDGQRARAGAPTLDRARRRVASR